jgi:SAM-dependent methyltransferase
MYMKTEKYSKTLDTHDYNIVPEMNFIEHIKSKFSGTFRDCHMHRNWEYGLCLNALRANGAVKILEIGGTGSVFAASAAELGMEVSVVDPDGEGTGLFDRQNLLLGRSAIQFKQLDFFQFQSVKKFDAVVCISTLEHVPDDENFFRRLLSLVKEGGLLYLTMDFHPGGQRFVDGHLRTYNQERLMTFIAIAQKYGFEPYGGVPDYSWRGEAVGQYTFASLVLQRRKKQETPIVLFINHKSQQCGVHQYGKRTADILKRSKKCHFLYVEVDSAEEYRQKIFEHRPNGIIYNFHPFTMKWVNPQILDNNRRNGIFNLALFHDLSAGNFDCYINLDPDFPENSITFSLPRPLFDYENTHASPQIPVINCFGLNWQGKQYSELAHLVNREFDHAVLNFHLPSSPFGFNEQKIEETVSACRGAITRKGIQLNFTHKFMSNEELLDFLGKGSLNAFLYDDLNGHGCASTIDYALSVKRPIAINKSFMFRHIRDAKPSICIENRSLKEIMAT